MVVVVNQRPIIVVVIPLEYPLVKTLYSKTVFEHDLVCILVVLHMYQLGTLGIYELPAKLSQISAL